MANKQIKQYAEVTDPANADLLLLQQGADDVYKKVQYINIIPQEWQDWDWTTGSNITLGNGTENYSKYIQIGKTVFFRLKLTLGSTSSLNASTTTITIPVTAHADYGTDANEPLGDTNVWVKDDGGDGYVGHISLDGDADTARLRVFEANTAILHSTGAGANVDASTPFTFATNDKIMIQGHYEAA